jgi:hypothetical protein
MLEGALIWGLATRGKGSGATTDIAIVGADIVVRRKIFSGLFCVTMLLPF